MMSKRRERRTLFRRRTAGNQRHSRRRPCPASSASTRYIEAGCASMSPPVNTLLQSITRCARRGRRRSDSPPASASRLGLLQREHVGARAASLGSVTNRFGSGSTRSSSRRAPHWAHGYHAQLRGTRRPSRPGGSPTGACRDYRPTLSGLGYAQRDHIHHSLR